ncbi:MAG TPA: HypC/HybG/HupF family hydrogenase formation chaperone [Ktedonobacterales bacterium]|nr:HypC/HybG/HupF family hydrogenase formation chaperone [Ktedonobacterales bacterium]
MCLSVPGRVTQVQGAMAEVEEEDGSKAWYNALPQPDVKVGDYVLTHANLIVAIISDTEALEMMQAYREAEDRLADEEQRSAKQNDLGPPDPDK